MAAARVLVTGSSGFIGRAIAKLLAAAGHAVIGLDPDPPDAASRATLRYVADDLSNPARLRALMAAEGITHVIHAGGVSGPMQMTDRPDRIVTINVIGSMTLLQAALDTGAKTFVYCSSGLVHGEYYRPQPIAEDYPLRPATAYACSKAAMEMALRGLWQKVPLDLCVLRYTVIYGPGRKKQNSFFLDDIVEAGAEDRPARVAAATPWPLLYIDDAAEAAVAACFAETRRQLAYHLAYPEQVSLEDIAAAAGHDGRPVTLDIDTTRPPVARGPVDIGAARRDFGFAPKIDHRAGIRRMVAVARARR